MAKDLQRVAVGIIGGGNMAENILRGLLLAGLVQPGKTMVSDISPERLTTLRERFGLQTTTDNVAVVKGCSVIVLAVKPQSMAGVLEEIRDASTPEKLFLSIAAGVRADVIAEGLARTGRVVRVMPNVAAKVLGSASALCAGPGAGEADLTLACRMFDALGTTEVVSEDLMDAVTGLSGSGPAYIFLLIEALADAGVRAGLSRKTALGLAAQTCAGAARMVLEGNEHPGVLKDMVTSPAGTTIAGVQQLEQRAFRGTVMAAVEAAVARSKELGRREGQPRKTGSV